ncbi:hypothetical protein Ppa06_58430 [Planomonospora parontospora subsp. parontospora]|uniref:Uncharacterized protein n=2 Tax=Planomonospora parontospora TaxID=58119 RepID=A0AA37BLX0_9ACTN|nr:hypothetical protein [Planomonospora parontospora]GGK91160.1 hypothetical protein GCM10010126_58230 [Planomonospora parontospora]GII12045.1 hypothetical protein Ppa06_58430 [Planomonospora parontospora subsp. parontospora]
MSKSRSLIFGTEPAVILYVINAVVAFFVTIPAVGLTEESAGWVMTIANGAIALLVAINTRPWVVSALTGALSTILTGLASFSLPFTEAQSGAFVVLVSAVLGLVLRGQVTPAAGPVTASKVVTENRYS